MDKTAFLKAFASALVAEFIKYPKQKKPRIKHHQAKIKEQTIDVIKVYDEQT